MAEYTIESYTQSDSQTTSAFVRDLEGKLNRKHKAGYVLASHQMAMENGFMSAQVVFVKDASSKSIIPLKTKNKK
ncbi:MAG: hypothetical protein KFW21_02930 [Spirochaetota bacterium]|nr:hypothetical protein [Spirochaetota bacterium]